VVKGITSTLVELEVGGTFVGIPGSSPSQVICSSECFFSRAFSLQKFCINTPSKEGEYDLVVKCIIPTLPMQSLIPLREVPGSSPGQVIFFCFQFNLIFPSVLWQEMSSINTPCWNGEYDLVVKCIMTHCRWKIAPASFVGVPGSSPGHSFVVFIFFKTASKKSVLTTVGNKTWWWNVSYPLYLFLLYAYFMWGSPVWVRARSSFFFAFNLIFFFYPVHFTARKSSINTPWKGDRKTWWWNESYPFSLVQEVCLLVGVPGSNPGQVIGPVQRFFFLPIHFFASENSHINTAYEREGIMTWWWNVSCPLSLHVVKLSCCGSPQFKSGSGH
jgi:hypothetical protein